MAGVIFRMDARSHEFPWGYHNDEPSKVEQIRSGERNLRHPPLMLTVVDALVFLTGTQDNSQEIVEVGRLLSAFCMALALALMADWAFVMVHPAAAWALALCLPFQPGFFEVGHYFKEDALFLFGIALALRALAFWSMEPGTASALFLGLALAVLAGSKYIGWLMVAMVLTQAYFVKSPPMAWKKLAIFFVLGLVAVYWPVFWRIQTLSFFFRDEVGLLFSGDYGAGYSVPHLLYWNRLCYDFSFTLTILSTAAYIAGVIRLRLRGYWLMPAACFLSMICLSWTSKYSDRYLLPVLLMGMVILVSGPVLLAKSFHKPGTKAPRLLNVVLSAFIPAFFLLSFKWQDFSQIYIAFQRDSRKELIAWMKENLDGSHVVLAEDTLAKVDDPAFDNKTWRSYFVADLGSFSELKSRGVTHLIISRDVYHRFIARNVVPEEASRELFERRKKFYQDLIRDGKVLWSSDAMDPKALHPGLKLFEVP